MRGTCDNADMDAAAARRARMVVRVYPSLTAHDRDDARFWAALPVEERVLQVWKLSEAQWRLRGEFPDASGLLDLLRAFVDGKVRFLVVGAYALGVHGRPRATGDLDVWVDPTPESAANVASALQQFGAPITEVSVDDSGRDVALVVASTHCPSTRTVPTGFPERSVPSILNPV